MLPYDRTSPRNSPARTLRFVPLMLLFCVACGDATDQSSTSQLQYAESLTGAGSNGRQPDFVDSAGNHFVWVQKVTAVPRPNEAPALDTATPPPTLDASRLAEDLKPRLLKDGHEYTLATPDLELAKKVLSGLPVAGTPAMRMPVPVEVAASPDNLDVRQSAYVFSADDRVPLACGASLQYPAEVSGLITGPSDCTGTLIGSHTVATAAHCLYSNGWLTTGQTWFSAGLDLDPSCPTYGRQFLANWAVIPGGFRTWDDTPQYDYAILDFSQYSPPPSQVVGGFAGTSSAMKGPLLIYGYGPGPAPLPPYMELPRGGVIDGIIVFRTYDYKHYIDIVPGDSGAALLDFYVHNDGFPYLVAIQSGQYYIYDPINNPFGYTRYNSARIYDGQVDSFFRAYGNWP